MEVSTNAYRGIEQEVSCGYTLNNQAFEEILEKLKLHYKITPKWILF